VRDGPEVVLGHVATLLNSLLSQNSILPERVYAVGVGVPGPVEFSTGLLIAPPIMPGWEAYPIRSYLRTLLPVANVIVDNDVNVMALGELRAGAGVGIDNFIFVKIGTGIGSGIVCHGFIYRGSDGCAGDIGHICVDREGQFAIVATLDVLKQLLRDHRSLPRRWRRRGMEQARTWLGGWNSTTNY
jgi:predicted NBD/HSP70 family sugar kinase